MNIPGEENNKNTWHRSFILELERTGITYQLLSSILSHTLQLTEHLAISLIDIQTPYLPDQLVHEQALFLQNKIKLVYLWEDVWLTKPQQVMARVQSLLGINKRIHGRKTQVKRISKPVADQFLNHNHLQGAVSARYKYGLILQEELVAVATFSALRKMNFAENYKSAELIRFAVKAGYSVTGGLSKLIAGFKEDLEPQDIMTYADRDWSAGDAYHRLGFQQTGILEPQYFVLTENLQRYIIKDSLDNGAEKVFNTGSLKFILKF
ncbi:hypothetical protein [Pedobacter rhizosphaerae]|uniref:Uncharacterized protein n=1 Tax=Pedobacter rhizosphaerae TaxID=390241 RepID=A0A1H9MDV2_9SPHI|nr:hypothetical protein [Pedobacter rhizosphaerae]SER21343.1 hypothetical protein SAMN04488023_105229 [Pedobacter rhizosphaerae]